MTDTDTLDKPLTEAQKLAADLEIVKLGNRNNDVGDLVSLSRERNNSLTAGNQMIADYDAMSPVQFMRTHGMAAYDEMAASGIGSSRVRDMANTDHRDFWTQAGDNVVNVGSGLVQSIGGLGVLGLSAVNDTAAVKAAQAMGSVKEFTDSLQSKTLNDRRRVNELRAVLDAQDEAIKHANDLKTEGGFTAGLRSIGRSALQGLGRLVEDPMMFETGLAEGAGSLLAGGPVAKALAMGAKAATGVAAGGRAAGLIEKAAFPTVIGALEGGGAFADVAQQIMAIPDEQLLQQSPEYVEMRGRGLTEEEAKVELAARAGNVASGIAAPVGALTGTLVKGIEAAPLVKMIGRNTVGGTTRDIALETVEEGIQSGTSPLAGNIGQVVSGANPNQDLSLGVGEQAAQGAAFGAGTTAAMQGPGLAVRAAGDLAKGGVNKLIASGKATKEAAAASASTSPSNVRAGVAQASQQAPDVVAGLQALADEHAAAAPTEVVPTTSVEGEPDQEEQTTPEDPADFIKRVGEATQFQPDDLKNASRNVRGKFEEFLGTHGRQPDKFEALFLAARIAADDNASEEDRTSAGIFVTKHLNDNKKLFEETVPDFLSKADQSRPEYQKFDMYSQYMKNLNEVPQIKQAMEWAQTKMKMSDQDLSKMEPAKLADVVQNTVNVAAHVPQAMNSNVANQILQQAEQGKLDLTPEQREAISNSVSMLDVNRLTGSSSSQGTETTATSATTETAAPKESKIDIIGRQIETEGGGQAHQKSVRQHVAEINQAVLSKDTKAIKASLHDLAQFARSQNNKLNAIKVAINRGDREKVSYEALGSSGRMLPADGTFNVFYNPGSAPSEKLHQKVHQEAVLLANLHNEIASRNPGLNLKPLPVPTLDPDGTEVAQTSTKTTKKEGSTTSTTSTVPKSRITPERAENLSNDQLKTAFKRAEAKRNKGKWTEEDTLTEDVLINERTRREEEFKLTEPKPGAKRKARGKKQYQAKLELEGQESFDFDQEAKSETTEEKPPEKPPEKPAGKIIKKRKAPTQRGPRDIIQFLADIGGIREYKNELRSLDVHKVFVPGVGKLVRAKGNNLDDARLSAAQEGYFDHVYGDRETAVAKSTIRDLLDLIEKNHRGERQFSSLDQSEVADRNAGESNQEEAFRTDMEEAIAEAETLDENELNNRINKLKDQMEEGELSNRDQALLEIYSDRLAQIETGTSLKDLPFDTELTDEQIAKASLEDLRERAAHLNYKVNLRRATPENIALLKRLNEELARRHKGEPEETTVENPPAPPSLPAPTEDQIPAEDQEDDTVPETTDVSEIYENLITPSGKNWFWKSFRRNKKINSRIIGMKNPLRELYALINSPEDQLKTIGEDLQIRNKTVWNAYLRMTNDIMRGLNARLEKFADAKNNKFNESDKSMLDLLDKGQNFNRYMFGKVLNLLEKEGNDYQYNKQLIQSAVVAAMDWRLNVQNRVTRDTAEDIARALKVDEDLIRPTDVTNWNRGISTSVAKRTLAAEIQKIWDVQPNKDMSETYTKGITEAVAAEILKVLASEEVGLLKLDNFTAPHLTQKTPGQVIFSETSPEITEMLKTLKQQRTVISDLAYVTKERTGKSVGEKISQVARFQLRNPFVRTTRMQQKAIGKSQDAKHFTNMTMLGFYKAFGVEPYAALLDGAKYDPDKTNKNDALSRDGKRVGLLTAFEGMLSHEAEVKAFVDKHNSDPANGNNQITAKDVPTYFQYDITSVGRMQQMGEFNNQSSKLARAVITPTRSVIDISNPGSNQFKHFLMAIGQGIGLKPEKNKLDVFAESVGKLIIEPEGPFRPLVQAMKDHLQSGNQNKPLPKEITDLFVNFRHEGKSITDHGMHSIMAVAQYEVLRDSGGDLTKFEDYNYLEADGISNGPANAMIMFAIGAFTAVQVALYAKVGFFLGKQGKTADMTEGDEKIDAYKTVANQTSLNINHIFEQFYGDEELTSQLQAFQRVLAALKIPLYGDITLTENGDGTTTIDIPRGLAKNPVTITVYGSGIAGIAGKIAHELITRVYQEYSTTLVNETEVGDMFYNDDKHNFQKDLGTLVNFQPYYDNENGEYSLSKTKHDTSNVSDIKDFTFSATEFNSLKQNVHWFLAQPMAQAIESELTGDNAGNILPVTGAMQKATQIQSVILQGLFYNAIVAKMAHKQENKDLYPEYNQGDLLSANELTEIMESLKPYTPIIDTGSQRYMIGGRESADLFGKATLQMGNKKVTVNMPIAFARALSKDLETPAYTWGPTQAGVKAVPVLTIGSGDGQMILYGFSSDEDNGNGPMSDHTLGVFDGVNMPVHEDSIKDFSQQNNKAVFKTWTENPPIKAVYESYAAFLRNDPLGNVFKKGSYNEQTDGLLYELAKIQHNKPKPQKALSVAQAKELLDLHAQTLRGLVRSTELRQQVLREMPSSTDQLASGKGSHNNKGTIEVPADATAEQIGAIMEARYNELEAQDKNRPAADIQPTNRETVEAIKSNSKLDETTGVRVMAVDQLKKAVDQLTGNLSPIHKEMLQKSFVRLMERGFKILVGSPNQLNNYEAIHVKGYTPDNGNAHGRADFKNNIIRISTVAGETITHEVIHAATFDKVFAYYNKNQGHLNQNDRDAIQRLEGLMGEWLLLKTEAEEDYINQAHVAARTSINKHLFGNPKSNIKPDKAAALNEFMAWVLGNQNLSDIASKTEVKNPAFKITRIIQNALGALKELIWGKQSVPGDILSNLRFNTKILLSTPTPVQLLKQEAPAVMLHQSPSFGNSDRLTYFREMMTNKVINYLEEYENSNTPEGVVIEAQRNREVQKAHQDTEDLLNMYAFHFPELNDMQAWSTFRDMHTAMMTDIRFNANSMSRIQEIYDHVIKELKVKDLRTNDDPNDQTDLRNAQDKFDVLHGIYGNKTDNYGRSSFLTSFLALAMTSDPFRAVLAKMDKPASFKGTDKNLDTLLENFGTASMDRASIWISGEKGSASKTVQEALDHLTVHMIKSVGDQRSFIELRTENGLDAAENYVANGIQKLSGKLFDKSSQTLQTNTNPLARGAARLGFATSVIINEKHGKNASLGLVNLLSKKGGLHEIKALMNDMVGRTKENAPIWDMTSFARSTAQQTRQRYREELPDNLAAEFSRPLLDQEKTHMFRGMAKNDLASLVDAYGATEAIKLVSDRQRALNETRLLEIAIRGNYGLSSGHIAAIIQKSKQLADFMNTDQRGDNLLKNARAIAKQFGNVSHFTVAEPDPQLVKDIDKLVTLYATTRLSQETRDTIGNLATTEMRGLEFTLHYLVGQRKDELTKANATPRGKANHYKGYIPSEQQQDGSLVIADDSEHAQWIKKGYTKVGTYLGSSADRGLRPKNYYFSPVSGQAPFRQGVMQTVHPTASGVDPETGYTLNSMTAGRITNGKAIQRINNLIANQRPTTEPLSAIYDDATGAVVAYERMADPDMLSKLNRSTDIHKMIGAWRGRQVEEIFGQSLNSELVDKLHTNWIALSQAGRANEFVNIYEPGDPVREDMAKLIPFSMRDEIEQKFGKDVFMVHKSQELMALGTRQASLGDLFTGQTRWSPQVQEKFEDLALGLFNTYPFRKAFGDNAAYRSIIRGEKTIQELVTNAKMNIVVRSVIVPAANIMSNMIQLMNRGVPIRDIIQGVPRKTIEINSYIKNRSLEIQLEAQLRVAEGKKDDVTIRKTTNRIQALHDSYRRLSIWPLIEAGEFNAISNGEVTVEDMALAEGKWSNFVAKMINKIPDNGLRTTARYAMVSRDTAMFQALARSVQYGDFVAKAILYDDQVNRKKLSSKDAIAMVSESFINYNQLAGRGRDIAEKMGLLWFYHFKLRAMKEAVYMARHHPIKSLMMMGPLGLDYFGSPITDNFGSVAVDGKLPYSIGWEQGLDAWKLNPWVQVSAAVF